MGTGELAVGGALIGFGLLLHAISSLTWTRSVRRRAPACSRSASPAATDCTCPWWTSSSRPSPDRSAIALQIADLRPCTPPTTAASWR